MTNEENLRYALDNVAIWNRATIADGNKLEKYTNEPLAKDIVAETHGLNNPSKNYTRLEGGSSTLTYPRWFNFARFIYVNTTGGSGEVFTIKCNSTECTGDIMGSCILRTEIRLDSSSTPVISSIISSLVDTINIVDGSFTEDSFKYTVTSGTYKYYDDTEVSCYYIDLYCCIPSKDCCLAFTLESIGDSDIITKDPRTTKKLKDIIFYQEQTASTSNSCTTSQLKNVFSNTWFSEASESYYKFATDNDSTIADESEDVSLAMNCETSAAGLAYNVSSAYNGSIALHKSKAYNGSVAMVESTASSGCIAIKSSMATNGSIALMGSNALNGSIALIGSVSTDGGFAVCNGTATQGSVAFSGGTANGDSFAWNEYSQAEAGSLAMGHRTYAEEGSMAFGIGLTNVADARYGSYSFGSATTRYGSFGIGLGDNIYTSAAQGSVAVGHSTSAINGSMSFGTSNYANYGSYAFGVGTSALYGSYAFGNRSYAEHGSVALYGYATYDSIAMMGGKSIGLQPKANAMSFGYNSYANADDTEGTKFGSTIAFGYCTSAVNHNNYAIGFKAYAGGAGGNFVFGNNDDYGFSSQLFMPYLEFPTIISPLANFGSYGKANENTIGYNSFVSADSASQGNHNISLYNSYIYNANCSLSWNNSAIIKNGTDTNCSSNIALNNSYLVSTDNFATNNILCDHAVVSGVKIGNNIDVGGLIIGTAAATTTTNNIVLGSGDNSDAVYRFGKTVDSHLKSLENWQSSISQNRFSYTDLSPTVYNSSKTFMLHDNYAYNSMMATIIGENNVTNGTNSAIVLGKGNTTNNAYNAYCIGEGNSVGGTNNIYTNFTLGQRNLCNKGNCSFNIGINNQIGGDAEFNIGLGLSGTDYQTILGKYNLPMSASSGRFQSELVTDAPILIVGNGYAEAEEVDVSKRVSSINEDNINRSNAMVVYQNGEVSATSFSDKYGDVRTKTITYSMCINEGNNRLSGDYINISAFDWQNGTRALENTGDTDANTLYEDGITRPTDELSLVEFDMKSNYEITIVANIENNEYQNDNSVNCYDFEIYVADTLSTHTTTDRAKLMKIKDTMFGNKHYSTYTASRVISAKLLNDINDHITRYGLKIPQLRYNDEYGCHELYDPENTSFPAIWVSMHLFITIKKL